MSGPTDERNIEIATSRRRFLLGGAASALAVESAKAQNAPAPQDGPSVPAGQTPLGTAPAPGPQGYKFLNSAEAETLTAMVDRLIPADDVGPGGVELGVLVFIDRELNGQFGTAARWYMSGPWGEGTPSQGWQLALTPRQIYRTALLTLERLCIGEKGKRFAKLSAVEQDGILHQLEAGKIDLDGISSADFFQLLWQNVVEGYLGDPLYGGNRNMAAWRMINFPGANPVLTAAVDLDGTLFQVDPVAIGQ
jgi:gluconate 2-dehydrogenase gamma chain